EHTTTVAWDIANLNEAIAATATEVYGPTATVVNECMRTWERNVASPAPPHARAGLARAGPAPPPRAGDVPVPTALGNRVCPRRGDTDSSADTVNVVGRAAGGRSAPLMARPSPPWLAVSRRCSPNSDTSSDGR